MSIPAFSINVTVESGTGRVVAAYFQLREGMSARQLEVQPGRVIADYDADGSLLGIELLGPCSAQVLDSIAAGEPEPVRRFLRDSAPSGLLSAA